MPGLRRAALSAAGLLLIAAPAYPQSPGLAGQDRLGAEPFGMAPQRPMERSLSRPAPVPRTAPPPVAPVPEAWPRLDAGAVLCRTQDDLRRRAAQLADPGSAAAVAPAHCRLVGTATPVTIVQRTGPGATEVAAPGGETGWTDVFLPDKAPRR